MTPLLQQWLLDHDMLTNRVHHAEATELLGLIPDNSIDLIVTSPPYDNLRKYNGYSFPFERIAHESYRVLKQGGVLVWVVGDATVDGSETLTSFRQALYFREVGFSAWQTIIYQKDGMPFPPHKRYYSQHEYMFVLSRGEPHTFNGIYELNKNAGRTLKVTNRQKDGTTKESRNIQIAEQKLLSSVWTISAGYMRTTTDKDAYAHPAMFPEELAERHILTWSNPGDIVLDYFGGSGTTAKMARNNGRRWITGDISGEYVELMRKRLAQPYTLPMWAA